MEPEYSKNSEVSPFAFWSTATPNNYLLNSLLLFTPSLSKRTFLTALSIRERIPKTTESRSDLEGLSREKSFPGTDLGTRSKVSGANTYVSHRYAHSCPPSVFERRRWHVDNTITIGAPLPACPTLLGMPIVRNHCVEMEEPREDVRRRGGRRRTPRETETRVYKGRRQRYINRCWVLRRDRLQNAHTRGDTEAQAARRTALARHRAHHTRALIPFSSGRASRNFFQGFGQRDFSRSTGATRERRDCDPFFPWRAPRRSMGILFRTKASCSARAFRDDSWPGF